VAGQLSREKSRVSQRVAPTGHEATERVWHELSKASFAVISYVTPSGEPRSSGVVYATVRRHLYMAVAPDGWKARHIADGQQVGVTIPIRRGGPLSLFVPIPPATVSFHARAIMHPAGSIDVGSVSKKFESLVPEERRSGCVLELVPEGTFVTYGVGVSLKDLGDPEVALAHVPVT
jgi:hypothetical protein